MIGQPHRILVIGLDCAEPELVFERWKADLPHLSRLMEGAYYGPFRSCDPPITVPAWSVMTSSRSPGSLGIYGFSNRVDYSYDNCSLALSTAVKEERLWDIFSRMEKDVVVLGVPQTFPVRPVRGKLVSCFLTPDIQAEYTYPPELAQEIKNTIGEYIFDVSDFRSTDTEGILKKIYEMTRKRFALAKHLIRDQWDFFMMVEMGMDRIHHALWQHMDPKHRNYQAGNPFESAIHDYYVEVDREIGQLLELVDETTTVIVVSDHGAKRMDGGICINEWLQREGYLVLNEEPKGPMPLAKASIDWNRTRVWGDGGYYGRVYLNVKGRESMGTVDAVDYESLRDELISKISAIPDHCGNPLPTQVFRPGDLYKKITGIPPDLIVYFGGLHWRSMGSVGMPGIHAFENDTGPDGANHAENGLFIMRPSSLLGMPRTEGPQKGLKLIDFAASVLALSGGPVPADMEGRPFSFLNENLEINHEA